MKFCGNCGTRNEDDALFCGACGADLETGEIPSGASAVADQAAGNRAESFEATKGGGHVGGTFGRFIESERKNRFVLNGLVLILSLLMLCSGFLGSVRYSYQCDWDNDGAAEKISVRQNAFNAFAALPLLTLIFGSSDEIRIKYNEEYTNLDRQISLAMDAAAMKYTAEYIAAFGRPKELKKVERKIEREIARQLKGVNLMRYDMLAPLFNGGPNDFQTASKYGLAIGLGALGGVFMLVRGVLGCIFTLLALIALIKRRSFGKPVRAAFLPFLMALVESMVIHYGGLGLGGFTVTAMVLALAAVALFGAYAVFIDRDFRAADPRGLLYAGAQAAGAAALVLCFVHAIHSPAGGLGSEGIKMIPYAMASAVMPVFPVCLGLQAALTSRCMNALWSGVRADAKGRTRRIVVMILTIVCCMPALLAMLTGQGAGAGIAALFAIAISIVLLVFHILFRTDKLPPAAAD